MHVVHVVPRLPPLVDGVGDYAVGLANRLRDDFGISSRFVACAGDLPVATGFQGEVLAQRTAVDLAKTLGQLDGDFVLVHYVGYGFDSNGVAQWVVDGLRDAKAERGSRIVTVFHEIYATSAPWRKAFWYSAAQKRNARALLEISDAVLTTVERNERIMRRWRPTVPIERLPIPSNIGEPEGALPPWEQRENVLVVFGLPHSRKRSYEGIKSMPDLCRRLGVQRILEIGPAPKQATRFDGLQVEHRADMPAVEVSAVLREARFGLLYYPAEYLAKSGIFAAYCAHGVATILPEGDRRVHSDLVEGRHYVADGGFDASRLPQVAMAAREWYSDHSSRQHAAWVAAQAGTTC